MAKGKHGFVLYTDLIHTVRKMPKEKAGELFITILQYVNDENPVVNDLMVDLVFEPIKQQLKRDLRKYEKKIIQCSEAGRASAEARKKQRASTDVEGRSTKSTDNDTVTDTVIVKDKDKKIKYADFITMTKTEHQKLIDSHGEKNTKILIEILNNYKGANGKKYKSDYLAILNWVVDRAKRDGKYENKPMMP